MKNRPARPRVPARSTAHRAAAALTLLVAIPGTPRPAPAQDAPIDTVSIVLEDGGAIVRLRIPSDGERIMVAVPRLSPQQELDVTEVVREGEALLDATLTDEGDSYRFEVESGAPVVITYRVMGATERIPLFVPGGLAELTVASEFEEPYLIRITGPPDRLEAIDTAISLPRLERVSDGLLEARLSSLPSFVRLTDRDPFAFGRIADLLALAVILLGAAWAWHRLRRRRAPRED